MLDIYWKAGKMGFQTKQGMHLTTARWRYAERLDDRTGIVCDAAGYALLRIHPRRLIPLDCERADRYGIGLVRIRRNGKFGLLDRDGKIRCVDPPSRAIQHYRPATKIRFAEPTRRMGAAARLRCDPAHKPAGQ